MNRLEDCLTCIERGEREAALRYYEEYFDDAGPDKEAEVAASFGSPEALAREIIAQSECGARTEQASASFNRSPEEFHSIRADLINANVTLTRGNEWRIDISYPDERIKPEISISNGVLRIDEERRPFNRFFRHGGWKPGRIDIVVPDAKFSSFHISGVNGATRVTGITLETILCNTVNGAVELEGVSADTIHGGSVNGDVSITNCRVLRKCKGDTVNGTVTLAGELRGEIIADAVNGTLRIATRLPVTEYNVDVSTLSGSVRVDGEKYRKEVHIVRGGANRIKVGAVNGSVSIDFGV